MKNILHIISSPRGDASYSIRLGNAIIDKITSLHPGSTVKVRNVAQQNLPHLSASHLDSFFTPKEQWTDSHASTIRESEEAVAEIQQADIIVIGVPLYNFGMPSALKAWIDHIVRSGVTFRYTANGVEGLLKDKKVYVALASGGIYSHGPMQFMDSVSPYLKNVFNFIGVTDFEIVRAEGTSMADHMGTALEKGISSIAV
ncbi:FMN-dependent NADH-azoreductase [Flavobacterium sp.]|uniref:FMN-dependent NADH-azoreductase n=1 Tax=Flavobacterium sp. TaxID=239 RepID=UPI0039E6B95C